MYLYNKIRNDFLRIEKYIRMKIKKLKNYQQNLRIRIFFTHFFSFLFPDIYKDFCFTIYRTKKILNCCVYRVIRTAIYFPI